MDKTDESKRKPGRPKGPRTIPVCIRMTEAEHAIYLKRGGAKWLKGLMTMFFLRK